MSSPAISSVLSQLLTEMKTLNGRISTLEGLVSVKPSAASAPAPKKERKSKPKSADSEPRAPTAWRVFTDRVRQTLREAGFEGKSLGTECVQFCSSLKEENADFSSWSESDILARRAAWSAPEVSKQKAAGKSWAKSSAPSVASEAEEAAPAKKERKNPWAGLSEEQKAERIAKMKAGKAAKKATEAPAEEEAPASDGESAPASVSSSEKKKRGPKKFSEMSPEEVAEAKAKRAAKKEAKSSAARAAAGAAAAAKMPLPPSPPSSVSALEGFQRVMLSGAPYWVNLQNGHCYNRLADGSQGDWAGIFSRTPKPHIDSSVAEPSDELVFPDVDEVD
jgi:hypothetical protein